MRSADLELSRHGKQATHRGAMKLMKLATIVCRDAGVRRARRQRGAKGGKEAKTSFIDVGVNCGPEYPNDQCLYSGVIDSGRGVEAR